MPRYILSYEGFLVDWRKHIDRAAEKTGVVWPAQPDQSDVKIEQFLTTDLYHERSTLEDVHNHPDVTSLVRETYQILTTIAAGDEDNGLLAQLDIMRTRFDEACETFSVAMATEELAVAQLRGELSARSTETEQVRQENSRLASFLEQQSVEIRGLADERDALVGTRDTLIAERDALVNAQASLIAERDALVNAQASLIAERDALLRDIIGIANERDAILTSRSWRLTAPLRLIRGLFARG